MSDIFYTEQKEFENEIIMLQTFFNCANKEKKIKI